MKQKNLYNRIVEIAKRYGFYVEETHESYLIYRTKAIATTDKYGYLMGILVDEWSSPSFSLWAVGGYYRITVKSLSETVFLNMIDNLCGLFYLHILSEEKI